MFARGLTVKYTIEEFGPIGGKFFHVEAEIEGCQWDQGDPSVGCASGWDGVLINEVTVTQLDDDGMPCVGVCLRIGEFEQLLERIEATINNDDKFMDKLNEAERERRSEPEDA